MHPAPQQVIAMVCRDMLAWVHQSLASERELLAALFGGQEAAGAPGSGAAPAEMPSMPALLDRVFESICKPLKVRAVHASAFSGARHLPSACGCCLQPLLQVLSSLMSSLAAQRPACDG